MPSLNPVNSIGLLYGLLNRGEAHLIPTWLMQEQKLAQVKSNQSNQVLVMTCRRCSRARWSYFRTTPSLQIAGVRRTFWRQPAQLSLWSITIIAVASKQCRCETDSQ